MRPVPSRRSIALGAALLWLVSGSAWAAPEPAGTFGPYASQEQAWRAFSGLWENMNRISVEKFETLQQPLKPEFQAKKEEQTRNRAEGRQIVTSDAQCIPAGMPRMMLNSAFEVLVRPNSIGLVTAGGGLQVRNIWLDGRKHTPEEDLFESFSGESLGRWEGDVLVVDTIGLRPTNEILYGVQGRKLTVVERFRKTGPDVLQVVTTVSDPAVFTTPWVYTTNYRRTQARTITEWSYCVAAFDREVGQDGKEMFDLTPPPDPRERR